MLFKINKLDGKDFLTDNDLLNQIVKLSKARKYDIVSKQAQELRAKNKKLAQALSSIIKEAKAALENNKP